MQKSDFHFDLPEELIAQTPIERREQSRLLCIDRSSGELEHRHFFELPDLLREGDCLVLNDSRVMPARLLGKRETGGAAEIVLLQEAPDPAGTDVPAPSPTNPSVGATVPGRPPAGTDVPPRPPAATNPSVGATVPGRPPAGTDAPTPPPIQWECLVRPGKKIRVGTKLTFGDGELTATVTGETDGGNRRIRFDYASGSGATTGGEFSEMLERLGKMPLPPYIHEELKDNERYQTVYSRATGSAAAPTAGLHFTQGLLDEISARGVNISYVTLHVGLGTFRPVKTKQIENHKMHAEYFIIPEATATAVNAAKANNKRVIAVGTTSCRTLESCADGAGRVSPFSGFTEIFIYPGYKFKCIDSLITNFHLPESTLIMLVSALAGRENILAAYNEAIKKRYRFFSFGDAMMIR